MTITDDIMEVLSSLPGDYENVDEYIHDLFEKLDAKEITAGRFTQLLNADATIISRQAVYQWVSGENSPSPRTMRLVMAIYGAEDWQYLFADSMLKLLARESAS